MVGIGSLVSSVGEGEGEGVGGVGEMRERRCVSALGRRAPGQGDTHALAVPSLRANYTHSLLSIDARVSNSTAVSVFSRLREMPCLVAARASNLKQTRESEGYGAGSHNKKG